MRVLLAGLETQRRDPRGWEAETLSPTRGGVEPERDVVYPVWFGTNRKPDGQGGFGSERHDRTSLGRVQLYAPEAHRFGETGNPFWKRLLRFDLRDDLMRHGEPPERRQRVHPVVEDGASFWRLSR